MDLNEDIRSVSYLKARAADVLTRINQTHRPMVITQNGQARAVIQDPESYEQMRKAIGLLKLLAQGESDVEKGRLMEQSRMFARLESRLKKKSGGRA